MSFAFPWREQWKVLYYLCMVQAVGSVPHFLSSLFDLMIISLFISNLFWADSFRQTSLFSSASFEAPEKDRAAYGSLQILLLSLFFLLFSSRENFFSSASSCVWLASEVGNELIPEELATRLEEGHVSCFYWCPKVAFYLLRFSSGMQVAESFVSYSSFTLCFTFSMQLCTLQDW